MNERIDQVIEHIRQHVHESIKVDQLAQMACLSVSQFYLTFKKHTGQTPGQLITDLRMQMAYERLLSGPVSVQALSEQCGYRNYESFSRVFKTTFGLAPDDLTQVVEHIRSRQRDVEGLYVMKVETMDEDALRSAIVNRLKAQQVPGDLLPEATAYQVRQKKAGDIGQDTLIKKKYIITEANHLLALPGEDS